MKRIVVLMVILLLSGAAFPGWFGKNSEEKNPYEGMTAKALYTEARDKIKKGDYTGATQRLEALESMYPFSLYAENAQLEMIYAYYKNEEYPAAAATAERFIHLYPRAKAVDYAYYMKGLSNFQQSRGAFSSFLPVDESWRDPGTQLQAYSDFATLIQKFPNSRYKANALQRMIYLRNMFAEKELNIANYYFERKMYVAAVERADYLIKNYPQAPSAEKALILSYQGNLALGLQDAAQDAKTVYKATYQKEMPESVFD